MIATIGGFEAVVIALIVVLMLLLAGAVIYILRSFIEAS